MKDPTREDMLAFLQTEKLILTGSYIASEDDFDIEEAIYWFSADYHGGQWSNLYSALSTSEFRPGMNARRPYAFAKDLYNMLVDEYANPEGNP
jgi:hypothetical protein